MQEVGRRSNRERTEETRSKLLATARDLFVRHGYSEAATPELVAAAGVTRGALYHHFPDKRALFAAVVEAEARCVAEFVRHADRKDDTIDALLVGGDAYLAAMAAPGRCRLLLIEAPVVLGPEAALALQEQHGERTLVEGLKAAIAAGQLPSLPVPSFARCLGAAFDRAAIAIATGANPTEERRVLHALIRGLASAARTSKADD